MVLRRDVFSTARRRSFVTTTFFLSFFLVGISLEQAVDGNFTGNASLLGHGPSELGYNDLSLERGVLENATCEAGFDWADNSAGISPCEMAAIIYACSTDHNGHNIVPLSPGEHYDPPSLKNNTVNVCQCSWAGYNLISMCTLCQGQTNSLFSWASYSYNCRNFTSSDSYFPAAYSALLPANASIPVYAQTNPTQWSNEVFNISQARDISNGTLSLHISAASHSSKPAAAIIGGSIGGAVVLLCFFSILIWIYRRNKIVSRAEAKYQNLATAASFTTTNRSPPPSVRPMSLTYSNFTHYSDTTGSLTNSTYPEPNSQVPTPYRKSYHLNYNDNTYHHPLTDLLIESRRRHTEPVDSHVISIRPNLQTSQYPTYPPSGPRRTDHTEIPTQDSTDGSRPRGTSSPPPYSPGVLAATAAVEENSASTRYT